MRNSRLARYGAALAGAALLAGCAGAPLRDEGAGVLTATEPPPRSLPPEALRNIRNVDLRSAILADQRIPIAVRQVMDACATCGLDNPVYIDFTGDEIDDVFVPVYTEREQIGNVAFTVQGGRLRLAFAVEGAHTTLDVVDGDLVLGRPVYAAGDPPCCPSGAPVWQTYRWTGGSMKAVGGASSTLPGLPTTAPRPPSPSAATGEPSLAARVGAATVVTP